MPGVKYNLADGVARARLCEIHKEGVGLLSKPRRQWAGVATLEFRPAVIASEAARRMAVDGGCRDFRGELLWMGAYLFVSQPGNHWGTASGCGGDSHTGSRRPCR
jgi:hypothetical protein